METTKRPEFSDDPLGLIDDAELKSVRDYLLSAQRHKLSWKEIDFRDNEDKIDKRDNYLGFLVGSLRREFFDTEYHEFLYDLGAALYKFPTEMFSPSPQIVTVQRIFEDMMEHGMGSKWFCISQDYEQYHRALHTLSGQYTNRFRNHPYLLSFITHQDNPLDLVNALETTVERRLSEEWEKPEHRGSFPNSSEGALTGLLYAMNVAQLSRDTPEGLLDMPYEVIFSFLTPVDRDFCTALLKEHRARKSAGGETQHLSLSAAAT